MKFIIKPKILVYCALLGVVIVITGVILGFHVFPSFVQKKVWENSILQENTPQWNFFKKIPFPLQIKVRFFNVENPNDILQGAKPQVKEVGPYIYKLYRWKNEITWDSKDEISFYDYMKFEFDREASGPYSDEDDVTILNSPYNALLLTVEALSPTILAAIDPALPSIFNEHNGLFLTSKVKNILFDGTIICKDGAEDDFTAKMVCSQFRAKVKDSKGMSIVGNSISSSYLGFKNMTHLGRFTIKSGSSNSDDLARLVKYENKSYVTAWGKRDSVCNQIDSVMGFRPYLTTNMSLEVFAEDVCRTMQMKYDGTESVKGLKGFKFSMANDSFNEPKPSDPNYCFCINKSRTMDGGFGCLKDGLLDLTNCVGAPVLLSLPHLLYGDKEYQNSVDGLSPNQTLHDTYVILDPISGTPLKMAKRIQFNMFIRAIEDIVDIENVTNALMPIFWIEESMTLEDEYTDMIKNTLYKNLKILEIIKWAMIGFGAIAIAVPIALIIYSS